MHRFSSIFLILVLAACDQHAGPREKFLVLSGVREDVPAAELAKLLEGCWESVYRHPGVNNVVELRLSRGRAAAVVQDAQGRRREVNGSSVLRPHRQPAPGVPTVVTLDIRTDSGIFPLRGLRIGWFAGLLKEEGQLLLIDQEPRGVLRKLTPP